MFPWYIIKGLARRIYKASTQITSFVPIFVILCGQMSPRVGRNWMGVKIVVVVGQDAIDRVIGVCEGT